MWKDATRTLQRFQTTLGFTTGMISKVHVSHWERSLLANTRKTIDQSSNQDNPMKESMWMCERTGTSIPNAQFLSNSSYTPRWKPTQDNTSHFLALPSALLYRMESWNKFTLFEQNSLQLHPLGLFYYLEWNITENVYQSEYIFWNTMYDHLHSHNQLISKQTPGRLSYVFQHIIQYVELWLTLKDWTTAVKLFGDPG